MSEPQTTSYSPKSFHNGPMKTPTARQQANRLVKLMGAIYLLVAAMGYLFISAFSWSLTSWVMVAGLFMLLFAPERIDDERVRQLKLRAITWGYAGGLLGLGFYEVIGKSFSLLNLPQLSAFDSLLMTTVVALLLFHYWRWRDGRQGGGGPQGTC